jgi:hypothetical protein
MNAEHRMVQMKGFARRLHRLMKKAMYLMQQTRTRNKHSKVDSVLKGHHADSTENLRNLRP